MKHVGARRIWSVADVVRALEARLEGIPPVWVEAEIHSLRPSGGQVYFTLTDGVQLRASMSATAFARQAPGVGDGDRVYVRGVVQLWRARTELSMRVDLVERAGDGALLAAVARLRAQLRAEGAGDPARVRPVPMFARRIAVVTSARGAAVRDFTTTAWARWPDADIVVVDVVVQGDGAEPSLVSGIARAGAIEGVEVVVVTRGGGPLEDLMPFNAESVCRAVMACPVPVVAAIGHERDECLVEMVADHRAATPTAAASLVVPDAEAVREHLAQAGARLERGCRSVYALGHTGVDEAQGRLTRALTARRERAGWALERSADRAAAALGRHADAARAGQEVRGQRLLRALSVAGARAREDLGRRNDVLAALSPYAVLSRGYAIVSHADGRPVSGVHAAGVGDSVRVHMTDGTLTATVDGHE